jgi:hypothetical protein
MTDTAAHPNIYAALAAAQMKMEPVVKGATNPHFKSKYADLSDVVQAAVPALNRNGIAYFARYEARDGQQYMVTVLHHGASDTSIECAVPLIVSKNDMQGFKSAVTYAKRIGLESVSGVAPEDDDGNAAAKGAPSREQQDAERQAHQDAEAVTKIDLMQTCETLEELAAFWKELPAMIRARPDVAKAKDERKAALTIPLEDDEIPY